MLIHLLEKSGLKKKLASFYRRSKTFRTLVNYFGMSAGASAFLFSLGGTCTCPFCGGYACPIGILSVIIVAALAAAIVTLFIKLWKIPTYLRLLKKSKNGPKQKNLYSRS